MDTDLSFVDVLRMLQSVSRALRQDISQPPSLRPTQSSVEERARDIVDGYFRADRPILFKQLGGELLFVKIDNSMQSLLRLTQRKNSIAAYKERLTEVQDAAATMELAGLDAMTALEDFRQAPFVAVEIVILERLQETRQVAAVCLEQALRDLRDPSRISWRGTATEFRECLRELLDHLAPDEDVRAMSGYKQDQNCKGPTMKQKAHFIMSTKNRLSGTTKALEDALDVVTEKVGAFVRGVYSQSSASVHATQEREEVESVRRFCQVALAELLGIAIPVD